MCIMYLDLVFDFASIVLDDECGLQHWSWYKGGVLLMLLLELG